MFVAYPGADEISEELHGANVTVDSVDLEDGPSARLTRVDNNGYGPVRLEWTDDDGSARQTRCTLSAFRMQSMGGKAAPQWNDRLASGATTILIANLPVGWVGFAFFLLWGLLFNPLIARWISGLMPLLPPESRSGMQDLLAQLESQMQNAELRALFLQLLYPAIALLALFLVSAVVHLVLLLAGGTSQSEGGFEGTFRALAYGNVALLALMLPIPLVNLLAAVAWLALLGVLGLAALHGTTKGRAAVAVLVPLGLCCCCWCLVSVLIDLSATGRLEGLW